jgi:hypothetical protein
MLVVVDDLDVYSLSVRPTEADTIPRIDTNAVLAFSIAPEGFESITRGGEVVELRGGDESVKSAASDREKRRRDC